MPRNVGGRDGYILRGALAMTHALIGQLPVECQRHDMGLLLRAILDDWKIKARHERDVLSAADWRGGEAPLARDKVDIDG